MLSGMSPLVSAIVLTFRSPRDTLACVRALLGQTLGDALEVIVVDNHSDTDSIGILRTQLPKDSRVHLVETEKNLGYGKGNNFGNRYATGEYVLIINPDNVMPPEALQRMVQRMESDPTIGILAPKLVFPSGTVRDSARAFPSFFDVFIKRTVLRYLFSKRLAAYTRSAVPGDQTSPQDMDWIAGACLLLRRSFFNELQGFDPRFFLFFEDIDLCRRTWVAGKRVVYDPSIIVADRERRLSEGGVLTLLTKKTVRWHLASAVKYFWKWRGRPTVRLVG
ncbi:MAG: glycosyltransferase family 2 protein [Patescibacteria group bacterium]